MTVCMVRHDIDLVHPVTFAELVARAESGEDGIRCEEVTGGPLKVIKGSPAKIPDVKSGFGCYYDGPGGIAYLVVAR